MDTTKTTTHVSLCAGYGGIDLGLGRAIPNLRTIAFSEIEAFACANLVSKMEAGLLDAAPIWTNLKTFPWSDFRDRVDILSGGYPCQPFSAAGKRLGRDDPRHLWPWIADGIRAMRPRICFFENVEGHISLGLSSVISDLEELGYKVSWGIFSAREVGAPHQRKRVFIMAYLKCAGLEGLYNWNSPSEQTEFVGADSGSGCQRSAWEGCELADASCHGHNGRQLQDGMDRWKGGQLSQPQRGESGSLRGQTFGCRQAWPSRPGQPQHGWEPPRVVGDASSYGRQHDQQSKNGWRAATAPESSECLGNAEHDGLHGAASSRGYEADAGSRSEKESEMEQQRQRASGLGSELCTSVGNANSTRPQERQGQRGAGIQGIDSDGGEDADGQAQSALGGDSDGSAYWVDYAKLYCTTDNRTDELRLLGNGVVPATAERAFRTLLTELLTNKTNI